MSRTQQPRSLAEIFSENRLNSYQIRPFPQVVVKLIELLRDPNTPLNAVSHIIESDAAMCVKVLKMANSPIIGAGQKITRVDHAITILGFNRIKALAQIHAAAVVMSGNGSNCDVRQSLWKHSLANATCCRVLAQRLGVADQSTSFMAGIFHDIGHFFLLDVAEDTYLPLRKSYHPLKTPEAELAQFGTSHQEAGMRLALAWELPEAVRIAIGFHHRPAQAIAHEEYAWIVYLADRVVHLFGIGSKVDTSIMQADFKRCPFYLTIELVNAIQFQVIEEFNEFQQTYG